MMVSLSVTIRARTGWVGRGYQVLTVGAKRRLLLLAELLRGENFFFKIQKYFIVKNMELV